MLCKPSTILPLSILPLLTFATPNFADKPWGGPSCPNQQQMISLTQETTAAIPPVAGLSIAISHPQCGDFTYVTGFANHDKQIPVDSNTLFPIASNTKPMIIALALMIMEERPSQFPQGLQTKLTEILDQENHPIFTADGKMNLPNNTQADLSKSAFYQEITGKPFDCSTDTVYACPQLNTIDMHHLLMESSGLADTHAELDLLHSGIPDAASYILRKLFSPITDPDSQKIINDLEALTLFGIVKKTNPDPIIPRQSHNTDAMMAALILERVSGKSLPELLNQYILKPLNISSDAMQFVSHTPTANKLIARRYAYLNTDDEIETAIAQDKLLSGIPPELARLLSPAVLSQYNKSITLLPYLLKNKTTYRPALDLLNIDTQGFVTGLGAGGIIAQPKAYVTFYRALAQGSLLSKKAQSIFNNSFMPIQEQAGISVGYGSNVRLNLTTNPNQTLPVLTHTGLVPGGESRVLHDEKTGTTIMLTTNFSGYSTHVIRDIPTFFVTKTPYFDADSILSLERKYIELITKNTHLSQK